jgi:hypothetical protein
MIPSYEEELKRNVSIGLLTEEQVAIFIDRMREPKAATYFKLRKKYNIKYDKSLIRCFVRTASGRKWSRNMIGGNDLYLSEVDQHLFLEIVRDRCDDMNCITTSCAYDVAFTLRSKRDKTAQYILIQMGLPLLALHLGDVFYPSQSWLKHFCDSKNIKICRAQQIELARRYFCNVDAIAHFFSTFPAAFQRDPRLIWNADETQLNASKRFKVLSPGKLPLVTAQSKFPHITGMVTISAAGEVMKPLIILKNLQHLTNLEELTEHCFFATSTSGYITKHLFVYFTLLFVAQMSLYRLTLPQELRTQPILLLLEGHRSRICFEAALIFHLFNIDVLILPPHTSHLIQPFDVAVASPLKIEFKKILDQKLHTINEADPAKREKSSLLRKLLVTAFIDALQKSATVSNIKAGFKSAGMSPWDPSRPLESEFAAAPPDPAIYILTPSECDVGCKVLTSSEGLEFLCNQTRGHRIVAGVDDQIDLSWVAACLHQNSPEAGHAISKVPSFFLSAADGILRELAIE